MKIMIMKKIGGAEVKKKREPVDEEGGKKRSDAA